MLGNLQEDLQEGNANVSTCTKLQVSALPKTQTVSVYARSAKCGKKNDPVGCGSSASSTFTYCETARTDAISAKTRSWGKAEGKAQEILDSWDPLKRSAGVGRPSTN